MQRKQGKVIFNFLPVRAGGGLQNSLSFLTLLASDMQFNQLSIILCWADSDIEALCLKKGLKYHSIPYSKVNRLCFEFFGASKVVKPKDVIFTLFGPPLLRNYGAKRINGCAYSNLFYPELDFWGFLRLPSRIIKKVIDFYRKRMLAQSDVIIFETNSLLQRAKKDILFKNKDLQLIEMSPSVLVDSKNVRKSVLRDFNSRLMKDGQIDILYLSGAHPNKRHFLLPAIIKELNSINGNYRLITTLPKSKYLERLEAEFHNRDIRECLINLGPISPEDVPSLIEATDCMCNIALLESFSNNFVEAWRMSKPLIVTDADWSRACCSTAAVYIDPIDSKKSAISINRVFSNNADLDLLALNGEKQLCNLPSREERYDMYKNIILEYLK
ncbi:glycosyltransferase [Pseudoalteromonas lipolytica]|uniref:Glycosyltransferase n=1 Tax=Pseudoalteromonas lipolytica TaxID=570156 RepID=A0ABU8SV78_9GAMM